MVENVFFIDNKKYFLKEEYVNYDSVFKCCLVIAINFKKHKFKVLLPLKDHQF